ncbi:addiction module antidote protein [Chelonobacter oris]
MTQLSKDTGLARESLYRTLSGETKPRFETVNKIVGALGLNVAFTPRHL